LREDNATAVNDLFQRVFGVSRTLEHHRWKFFDYADGEGFAAVATHKPSGKVVAAMGGRPRRIWIDGREVLFMQTCEMATDEDWRSIGLYRKIVSKLVREAYDRQLRMAFGGQINKAAWVLGKRLFCYRSLAKLRTWERRLSLRPAARARLGVAGRLMASVADRLRPPRAAAAERDYRFERRQRFGPETDLLWLRLRDRYGVACVRDAKALNHRFADCPMGEHRIWLARQGDELAGYIVTRLWERDGTRLGTVLDYLDGGDPRLAEALFSRALRDAARRGADFFHVAPLPGSSGEAGARALAGCRVSEREPVDRAVICLLIQDDPHDPENLFLLDAFDSAHWHYTQGDSDFHD